MADEKVNLRKLRTGKEKFYLVIVIGFSILVWAWLAFSIVRQVFASLEDSDKTQACYVKDILNGQVSRVADTALLPGEQCISWDKLTTSEQESISKSTNTTWDAIIAGITLPVFLLFSFFLNLFLHLLAMAYIRQNSVKVGPSQFPEIWEAVVKMSKRLGMDNSPSTFVILGNGVVNAFATRLVFRRLLVLYSDLVEAMVKEKNQTQLEAVMGHELGHHLLGHTHVFNWFLWPADYIPLLGAALSRAREYSSDRTMKALILNDEVCERALVKLAAGKRLGETANIEAFLEQAREERGFFSWLSERLSSHPFLPRRILAVRKFRQAPALEEATSETPTKDLQKL